MDATDNGEVDFSDALDVLKYLFLGGIDIPAPGPENCGVDPTDDPGAPGGDLGCESFPPCDKT